MIQLGSKVKDKVSGFTGIAMARTEWLYGCARVTVQPPVDKDGKLPDTMSFDEPQLEVLELPAAALTDPEPVGDEVKKPGGPRLDPRRPDTPARR